MKKEKSGSFFKNISQDEIDALQEIGNIGSGHSANALADLLNRRIDMSLPRFKLLKTSELSQVDWRGMGPKTIFGVVISETTGDLELNVIVVFDEETIKGLINLIRQPDGDLSLEDLSNYDKSILTEVGNILSLHYVTAINTFLRTKAFPQSPILAIEPSETILSSIAAHFGAESDFTHLLLVECDIFTSDTKLQPVVILAPEEKSVEKSLKLMFGDI